MNTQTEIKFPVLTPQNNKQSEQILLKQEKRLSHNCQILFDALLCGEELTGNIIIKNYNILEYRARIRDLKRAGVPIQEKILNNGSKLW